MKQLNFLLISIVCIACSKKQVKEDTITTQEIDSLYTLNKDYPLNDVRRYGVFPNQEIGDHPKLKINKLEAILNLAERGKELHFPKGTYSKTLAIENRKNVTLDFNNVIFTGSILIKKSENIKLLGNVTSLIQFYTKDSKNIGIDNIFLKSDTLKSSNRKRNLGCSIHSGTDNISIKKIYVEDVISSKEFKNVKGGLIIHGHNNEPTNVSIDTVFIKSSDRHGTYITGENININYLDVERFGIGSGENMTPMEGGIEGEQYLFSGLWIKNAHNSRIQKVIINGINSKGKYSTNFDFGEGYYPTTIDTLIVKGTQKTKVIEETAVQVETLIND